MPKVIRGRGSHAALPAVAVSAAGLAFPATAVAAGCAEGEWTAKFYAGTSFGGTPRKTACDKAIGENYPTFKDTTGMAGQRYAYVVTATDGLGNEGEASAWVHGAKTP